MTKRILFVDDEEQLLDGLRRALRGQRKHWDMRFALSGADALDLLSREPVDVIVTDMHMPGMDGVELLEKVMRISPRTIRIVLTGHSDDELVLRSVAVAHQYFGKPSDVEILRSTITRALKLRDLIHNPEIGALVAGMPALPSLPRIYQEITQLLQSPAFSLKQVGELIATDPPMTAKLLQLVNSAFFGIGRRITDPAQAVTLLGLDTMRNLVFSAGVFSQFEADSIPGGSRELERVWRQSLKVGVLAGRIAEEESAGQTCIADSCLAGLLYQLGPLLLMAGMPEQWSAFQRKLQLPESVSDALELEILGARSSYIGGYLLALWGLPDAIVEAVSCQREPGVLEQKGFLPLTAVHVAQALVGADADAIDQSYLQSLGLLHRLEAWREIDL